MNCRTPAAGCLFTTGLMLYIRILSHKNIMDKLCALLFNKKKMCTASVCSWNPLFTEISWKTGNWMRIVSKKQVDFVNGLFMFQLTKPIQTLSAAKWINGNHFPRVKEKANENGIAEGQVASPGILVQYPNGCMHLERFSNLCEIFTYLRSVLAQWANANFIVLKLIY